VIRVFVYGTLCRGERAHRLLQGCRYVGEFLTEEAWELVHMGGYPGLVAGGACAVRGEVYEIPPGMLPDLDEYEGPEYERRPIRLADGSEAEAWVMDPHHGEGRARIEHGDWRRR